MGKFSEVYITVIGDKYIHKTNVQYTLDAQFTIVYFLTNVSSGPTNFSKRVYILHHI